MFFVVEGNLTIKLRDEDLSLTAGQFAIIPKGVEHCPVAEEECQVMLFEPKTVVNIGNVQNDLTVKDPEHL